MSKEKVTIERIKTEFENIGYVLISTEYIARGKPLKCKCDKNHDYSISWAGFKYYGRRCSTCNPPVTLIKITIDFIKQEFAKVNYVLTSTIYVNSITKLKYVCSNDHTSEISWNAFQSGQRCQGCHKLTNKYGIDEVINYLKSIEYTLLDGKYIDSHQKMNVTCPNGHNSKVTLNALKSGTRCFDCRYDSLRLPFDEVKKCFENNGCKLLSTYNNYDEKLKYVCICGSISYASYASIKNGGKCGCIKSKGEAKIKKYLTSNDIEHDTQKTYPNLKIKRKLSYDFIIDHNDIQFLLEFDGSQHFKGSDRYKKPTESDRLKNEYCLYSCIKLLRISYREIDYVEQIIDYYINNFKNINQTITYSNPKLYKEMASNIKINLLTIPLLF